MQANCRFIATSALTRSAPRGYPILTVWNSGQPGYIDEDKSKWLLGALAAEGATDRGRRALVAIAKEAECFDETGISCEASRLSGLTRSMLPASRLSTVATPAGLSDEHGQ